MSRLLRALPSALVTLLAVNSALSQSTMAPIASFGTNGWIAPGASAFVTTGNTERGLAYNPITGNLVLVSRAGGTNLRVLDGVTGADLGALDSTGITGGTFVVSQGEVADDGIIYVCNLSTSIGAAFKVYKWDSEALGLVTPPTVAYTGTPGVTRLGDSFAVYGGSAVPAQFAAAGSNNVSASNFAVGSLDGLNTATPYLSVPGTTTTSNDYRLALTWIDQNTLLGNQGANVRVTALAGATATLSASIPVGAAQRAMDYAVIAGTPVLAILDTNSSIVRIYDITVPTAPTLLTSATTTTGTLTANGNGTGSVQWGAISGNSATLYAMSSNQGIQAFQVTIDLPASAQPFGIGCGTPALALSAVGAPILPSTIQLQVDNLPVTTGAGFFLLGFGSIPGGAPIPVAPGCLQYVIPVSTLFFFPLGAPSFQQPLGFPNDPGFAGFEVFVQGGAFDGVSSAITATNGLRLYLKTF